MKNHLRGFIRKTYIWWKFRHVKLREVGLGCMYKSASSNFVASNQISLGKNVHIGPGAMLDGTGSIIIGEGTIIAPDVYIYSRTHNFSDELTALPFDNIVLTKKVNIGKYVWIGARVTILPGVSIGDGAVIGAGAVVAKDVPSCAVAAGNPARVLKYRDREKFEELLNSHDPFVYNRFGHAKIVRAVGP